MFKNPLLLCTGKKYVTVTFDVGEMSGSGQSTFEVEYGKSLSESGFTFPKYDFSNTLYTSCGEWYDESETKITTSTKFLKATTLTAKKYNAFPESGSITITVTPAKLEDTSWSGCYYKYQGFSNYTSSTTFGSISVTGDSSWFSPCRCFFSAEQWNSSGSIRGTINVDFAPKSSLYFRKKTKFTLSPAPSVSALGATCDNEEIISQYDDTWAVASFSEYYISCNYDYYSLDKWQYTLTWEPVD